METFKIISVILFVSHYCMGHFSLRNQNNRQSPAIPLFNFKPYLEYLKPIYRIGYLSPKSTTETRTDLRASSPTVPSSKKHTTPLKKHNGVLSIIKNLIKPLTERIGNTNGIVKKHTKGREVASRNLKLLPKVIKKVSAKHFEKMPKDKFVNNTKSKIDLSNNKEKDSTESLSLNDLLNIEGIKKKTEYINKMDAKSIFGNFEDNKHFANIFIFHPMSHNSALVDLKDNVTDIFSINSTENTNKNSINETSENGKEGNPFTVNDGSVLVGNKDEESPHDNGENRTISTVDIITTENMFMTPDSTVTTTKTSAALVDNVYENQEENEMTTKEEDKQINGNGENVLSIIDDVEEVVTPKANNSSKFTTEATSESEGTTTEDLPITSTLISTTIDSFYTSIVNIGGKESTESLTENDESIVSSTVVNEITESIPENLNDTKDEENIDYQDYSETKDDIKENDIDLTVGPFAVVTPEAESTFNDLPEKNYELTDYVAKETDILYDQKEIDDTITEINMESTVTSVPAVLTTEDVDFTPTDVPTTTDNYVETTEADTESESNIIVDNTTELTTIHTLSTGEGATTTQSNQKKRHFNSLAEAINDDYIEIEYTYNIFLK